MPLFLCDRTSGLRAGDFCAQWLFEAPHGVVVVGLMKNPSRVGHFSVQSTTLLSHHLMSVTCYLNASVIRLESLNVRLGINSGVATGSARQLSSMPIQFLKLWRLRTSVFRYRRRVINLQIVGYYRLSDYVSAGLSVRHQVCQWGLTHKMRSWKPKVPPPHGVLVPIFFPSLWGTPQN